MLGRIILLLVVLPAAVGQVAVFEGGQPPEECGWTRDARLYPCDRWSEGGWFCQYGQIVQEEPIQFGEDDFYRRSLRDMAASPTWFLEYRVISDGYPAYATVAPSVVAASGTKGVWYHFTIGDVEIRFFPDIRFDFTFAEIEPGVPHVYRLEVRPGSYIVWIDGEVIDAGVPYGPYPTADSVIVFGARAAGEDSTTCWDYIRFGVIPQDASGDFDSDGVVGPFDLPYFVECLSTEAGAWPGCRWADMDGDGDVNAFDIAAFIDRFAEPARELHTGRRTP